jgi:PTS system mannose-specific IIA component
MITIVIVTHGDFGAYLVEAGEMIVGAQSEGVELVSISPRMPIDKASEHLSEVVEKCYEQKSSGVIIFTDIFGGTPTNISIPKVLNRYDAVVISGVNLNMLLSAFSYRKKLSFAELVEKVLADGKKAICNVSSLMEQAKNKGK